MKPALPVAGVADPRFDLAELRSEPAHGSPSIFDIRESALHELKEASPVLNGRVAPLDDGAFLRTDDLERVACVAERFRALMQQTDPHHLSTYLGHASVAGTQVYLTMTPELLGEAASRFERYVQTGTGGGDD